MRIYKTNDVVIKVSGNAAKFINGLSSNTIDRPQNAFLNMHGRIISTFAQQMNSDDEMMLIVPRLTMDAVMGHLDRYARLNKSTLTLTDLKVYFDLDKGEPLVTSEELPAAVSEGEFILYRLNRGLPLMGIDYQADEFILNVHEHEYVSYTKGCFLGQEPVAKVHNRAKPVRKLIVAKSNELSPEEQDKMTSVVKDPVTAELKGFVFVKNA